MARTRFAIIGKRVPRAYLCGLTVFHIALFLVVGCAVTASAKTGTPARISFRDRPTSEGTLLPVQQTNQSLVPGATVEKNLSSGETESYAVLLGAGDFVSITIEQQGIDVALSVLAPDGHQVSQMDTPNGLWGKEKVAVLASLPGKYQIVVNSKDKGVAPGDFSLSFQKLTLTSEQQQARLQAEKNFVEAKHLSEVLTRDSLERALVAYLEAQRYWETQADDDANATTLLGIESVYRLLHRWDIDDESLQKASESLQTALQLRQKIHDDRGEAFIWNEIGTLSCIDYRKPAESLGYYQKAHAIFTKLNDARSLASTFNYLGFAHQSLGELGEAGANYRQALILWQQVGNRSRTARALANFA